MNGVHKMGWAKIAYSYSINQLHEVAQMEQTMASEFVSNSSQIYEQSVRKVMRQGGDTDTNCAIVGSLIGSIVGFKGLPQEFVRKVI